MLATFSASVGISCRLEWPSGRSVPFRSVPLSLTPWQLLARWKLKIDMALLVGCPHPPIRPSAHPPIGSSALQPRQFSSPHDFPPLILHAPPLLTESLAVIVRRLCRVFKTLPCTYSRSSIWSIRSPKRAQIVMTMPHSGINCSASAHFNVLECVWM